MRGLPNLRRYSDRRPNGHAYSSTIGLDNSDAKRDKRNKRLGDYTTLRRHQRGRRGPPVILFHISSFRRSFLYSFVSPSFLKAIVGKIGGKQRSHKGGCRVKLRDGDIERQNEEGRWRGRTVGEEGGGSLNGRKGGMSKAERAEGWSVYRADGRRKTGRKQGLMYLKIHTLLSDNCRTGFRGGRY